MIKDIKEKNELLDVKQEKINKLQELFPNCFNSNGDFDIETFKNDITGNINVNKEGYGLNFLGKNYAKLVASLDTETILVPDEEENKKDDNKNSENIYISGDNIDALKHLVKSYSKKIKFIYIDPPYNTGTDGFVYNDKFNLTVEKLEEVLDINEDEAKRIFDFTNTKSNSHSAWLTFMFPRLYLARQLLTKDGIVFISIDDNESSNLKLLCDNIFGESEFIAQMPRITTIKGKNDEKKVATSHDYVFVYGGGEVNKLAKNKDFRSIERYKLEDERGKYYVEATLDAVSLPYSKALDFDISINGKTISPIIYNGKKTCWRWSKELVDFGLKNDLIVEKNGRLYTKTYLNYEIKKIDDKYKIVEKDVGGTFRSLLLLDYKFSNNEASRALKNLQINFDYSKPVSLIKQLIQLIPNNSNDIYLDFFSGSGTTAHAVMQLNSEDHGNRKYIMVQLEEKCKEDSPEYKAGFKTIDELGQERIRRAAKKIKEESHADIDYGFKHYTIKEVNTNTLDKLEKFEPNFMLSDKTILDEFGIDSILTTWMVSDGYGLTDKYDELEMDGYKAYKCKNTVYLINPELSDKAIKHLIEKYEKENFDCNRIVLFGYSFTLSEIQTLKDNIKQVKNIKNINVDVIARY